MWQRIQILYILLVVVLMTLAMFLPVAEFFDSVKNILYQMDYRGILQIKPASSGAAVLASSPLTFLYGLILVLGLTALFKFKNRKQQFRLCTLNFFLILIYIIALGIYIWMGKNALKESALSLKIPVVLPVIALILNYLAMRGIMKDENLVKSLDRLR